MKSIKNISLQSYSKAIRADEITEFHAARLILLFQVCGKDGEISGLTKMAKLDFFIRYPQFFVQACKTLGKDVTVTSEFIESTMVRYHYGPWDYRYYQILAYLRSRGIIEIAKDKKTYKIQLTELGKEIAAKFLVRPEFMPIIDHMTIVSEIMGKMTGSRLKRLVYEVFDEQVAKRNLGEVITE